MPVSLCVCFICLSFSVYLLEISSQIHFMAYITKQYVALSLMKRSNHIACILLDVSEQAETQQ